MADLRQRLQRGGSDLIVRVGRPEEVLPELARRVGAGAVYCHGEVTYRDLQVRVCGRLCQWVHGYVCGRFILRETFYS